MKKLCFLFCCFFPTCFLAQVGGSSIYAFLNLPTSARGASLGGNLIAIRDDDNNVAIQNPSLLRKVHDNQLSLTYMNYFAGTNSGNAFYTKNYDSVGTFSAGLQYLNYGKFSEADASGQIVGQFKADETCFNIGYGRIIDSSFSVGANLKTIYSSFLNYSSFGSAIDLAATYFNAKKRIVISGLIKNAGIQWKPYLKGNREPLPFEAQLGFSKKLKHAPFRLLVTAQHLERWDLTYEDPLNPSITIDPLTKETIQPNKNKVFADKLMRHFVIGTELLLTKNFNIRLGYNYQKRKELKIAERPGAVGFSFGFGFKISKFQFNYGRATYHVAGATNNFSITTNLSEFYSKK